MPALATAGEEGQLSLKQKGSGGAGRLGVGSGADASVGTAECLGGGPLDGAGGLAANPGERWSHGPGGAELGRAAAAQVSGKSGSGIILLLHSGIRKE